MKKPRFIYEILDYSAFNKYMQRKHKRTKEAILYAVNNKTSISEGARKMGIIYIAHILNHSRILVKNGIMKKTRTPPRSLDPSEINEKNKKTLRKEIRYLIMSSSAETLKDILIILKSSPTEETKDV